MSVWYHNTTHEGGGMKPESVVAELSYLVREAGEALSVGDA
jgi:hypothetical protein